MFESLSSRFGAVFDSLRGRGALTERDVDAALREIRQALLEADVALPVARDFAERVRTKAVGRAVLSSISPGQQVVKIVHDELVEALGDKNAGELKIDSPPAIILFVGLQGSGKTTTAAKIAKRLSEREGKKALMASLDNRRPAAMEQLAMLGESAGIDTLEIVPGQDAIRIANRARDRAERGAYDVLLLDTAGRMTVDDELMAETVAIRDAVRPRETLLVADSLTGQTAAQVADGFHKTLGITGVVLTRLDGDGRGGAALSMRALTGQPIRFAGVGERLEDLEAFHPDRIASRIVGMGDMATLLETARESTGEETETRTVRRIQKGKFDLNDMRSQLENVTRMGGLEKTLSMLPGLGALQRKVAEEAPLLRQVAIIQSMTENERREPDILKASRKRRVASGAGVSVQEVNRLLRGYWHMHSAVRGLAKPAGAAAGSSSPPSMAPSDLMQALGSPPKRKKRRTARW